MFMLTYNGVNLEYLKEQLYFKDYVLQYDSLKKLIDLKGEKIKECINDLGLNLSDLNIPHIVKDKENNIHFIHHKENKEGNVITIAFRLKDNRLELYYANNMDKDDEHCLADVIDYYNCIVSDDALSFYYLDDEILAHELVMFAMDIDNYGGVLNKDYIIEF